MHGLFAADGALRTVGAAVGTLEETPHFIAGISHGNTIKHDESLPLVAGMT